LIAENLGKLTAHHYVAKSAHISIN